MFQGQNLRERKSTDLNENYNLKKEDYLTEDESHIFPRMSEEPIVIKTDKFTVTDKDVKDWKNLFGILSGAIDLWNKIFNKKK